MSNPLHLCLVIRDEKSVEHVSLFPIYYLIDQLKSDLSTQRLT